MTSSPIVFTTRPSRSSHTARMTSRQRPIISSAVASPTVS
jgi:hypothetical protein